jgi:hypothetical protein
MSISIHSLPTMYFLPGRYSPTPNVSKQQGKYISCVGGFLPGAILANSEREQTAG